MKRYLKITFIAGFAWGSTMFGFFTAEFINIFSSNLSSVQLLIVCIAGGLLFGIFVSFVLYIFDRKRISKGIDINKDRLRPTNSLVINAPLDIAMKKIVESLSVLINAKIKSESTDELIVKTGVNKRTWNQQRSATIF